MTGPRVTHLVVGPAGHGVTEHSRHLAVACGHRWFEEARAPEAGGVQAILRPTIPQSSAPQSSAPHPQIPHPQIPHPQIPHPQILHLSVTDALFGRDAREAAERVCALVAEAHQVGALVTATFHDIPQPAEGGPRYRQRGQAYRRIVEVCDGIAYCSGHERRLAVAAGLPEHPATAVVPLPVWAPRATTGDPGVAGLEQAVVVFGHLYPGKGHREAIEHLAVSGAEAPSALIALGACSPGHEDLAPELEALGAATGVRVRVTGLVPDGRVVPALRRAGIPVAPHRHVSASGSIAAWIAAGRRPLVADSPYTVELEERWPGSVRRVAPGGWPAALAVAAREPESTRSQVVPRWGWPEVGRAYGRFFSAVAAGAGRPGTGAGL